jgi:hypothetical protein
LEKGGVVAAEQDSKLGGYMKAINVISSPTIT